MRGVLLYLIIPIIGLIIFQETITVGAANDIIDYELIIRNCSNRLDFKSVAEFRRFMAEFHKLKDVANPHQIAATSKHKKADIDGFNKCLAERESIVELEKLISQYDKIRPCKYKEIGKLVEFANNYLFDNRQALASKFFTLFGVNLGIQCKLNLLAHLKQADMEADQTDFIYSMASPSGWMVLVNEYTKKSMKFGGSSHADSSLINKIAKLVPGLTQVEHLDYLNFGHKLNDIKDVKSFDGKLERGSYKLTTSDHETAGDLTNNNNNKKKKRLVESLQRIIDSCKSLDQFYVNSLLSLARLKELGLLVSYLNEFQEPSWMLHKWLAAASFCQLMVRVQLTETREEDPNEINFEIVHLDELLVSRRSLYSYVAHLDEIGPAAREAAWRASLSGGGWRQKGEAMFQAGSESSVAMKQLRQFVRGVELSWS